MSELDKALTFDEVSEILRIVDGVPRGGELTVRLGDASLTLKLAAAGAAPVAAPPAPAAQTPVAPVAPDAAGERAAAPAKLGSDGPVDHEGLVSVKSPMTGVWYRSPLPGEPPFVDVGDAVEEGQQLGIIEVMKLMNRIVAPCAGTIRELPLANEALAEYDAALVWIEPSTS